MAPQPEPIYLDNCATTPLDPLVLEDMAEAFASTFGNASSQHSIGRRASLLLQKARFTVAEKLSAVPAEIIFTGSGTEANNLVIHTVVQQTDTAHPVHIIATSVEHPSVAKRLEWEVAHGAGRVEVDWLTVDSRGEVQWDALPSLVKPHTRLITIIHGNNETGVLQDLDRIKEIKLRYPRCLLHVDAVQTFTKKPINLKELPVDFLTISAHKIHGPKGAAALFVRSGVPIDPLLVGGAQEKYRRAGTENLPAIQGFATAILVAPTSEHYIKYMAELELEFIAGLPRDKFRDNMASASRLPGFLNLAFPRYPSKEDLLIALDIEGVCVSSTSACHTGVVDDSHVLRAMGIPSELRQRSIRIQFNRFHCVSDAAEAARRFTKVILRAQ